MNKTILPLTESASRYNHLERMPLATILMSINNEDKTVPYSVEEAIPAIQRLVNCIVGKMKKGGRIFYIGSGTSGRLGIVDASECPPTFGVAPDKVIALIAGSDGAIRKAVEFAEDNLQQGWKDLKQYDVNTGDVVIGLSASGNTPYVKAALEKCKRNSITTGSITCSPKSPISRIVDYPVEIITGPEFITGSTRMKAGTAQKLVLNMISTAVMIKLGRVKGNRMVDMQLSNTKLVNRGTRMIESELGLSRPEAKRLLLKVGSVRAALHKRANKKINHS
jgi:N-acetylmuramic acid 6-phosphate etherase